jgi:2-deoxy-D-gluconate 3-dehydrogenase
LRNDPVRWPQILNRIPAQRLGDPNGWVGAAVFLACAASSHVHGHAWVMDEVGCLDELEF